MARLALGMWLVALAVLSGCAPGRSRVERGNRDGGMRTGNDAGVLSGCVESRDADGDGIADAAEGDGDTDADGTPNHLDDDSDNDGILDRDEHRGGGPCTRPDSDGDGMADWVDTDADNDGLLDAEERGMFSTDPYNRDSDGDGVTDLGEVRGTMTDPNDPASTIAPGDFFVVLPYNGVHENRTLRFSTNIEVADVFFLVDMTGSMQGERRNLIQGLVDVIIPGIAARIRDVQFGAGGFDDYPTGSYGGGNDQPFYLLREIGPADEDRGRWSIGSASATTCPSNPATRDIGTITGAANGVPDILDAVQGLPCHGGGDGAESYVPALYATATGEGLSWPGGSVPPRTCPSIPDEAGRRVGYPCFRPGALPIILLFGDWDFHNGPSGANPYSFSAPTYGQTVAALGDIGARVLGIYSQGSPTYRNHYEAIARDTGAVTTGATPLVFDINTDGSGLSGAVVDAVSTLVGGTPQDVTTRTENVDGNPDGFDATLFIKSIVPVEGYRDGVAGANPGVSYRSKDDTTFYEVIPGAEVEFAIDFHNDVRMPASTAQIFKARIVVVGNGVANLDVRDVYIVVPPDGGVILI